MGFLATWLTPSAMSGVRHCSWSTRTPASPTTSRSKRSSSPSSVTPRWSPTSTTCLAFQPRLTSTKVVRSRQGHRMLTSCASSARAGVISFRVQTSILCVWVPAVTAWGGRIAIHFIAVTPAVRAFVGYYPTVRDEPVTDLRPRRPWEAAKELRCPSIVLYGAHDRVTTIPIQERVWASFQANGQSLEWHFFPFGGHGFVDPGTAGYHPHSAELSWPLVCDFLARELDNQSP